MCMGHGLFGRGHAHHDHEREHEHAQSAAPDPLEIVQRRYAAGEISRDEYLTLLEDLGYETVEDLGAMVARKVKKAKRSEN